MLRFTAALAAIALVGMGCSFSVTATSDGGPGDDAPPPPTVGFAVASSTHDEDSGLVMVTVQLSAPATGAVTVDYAFGGSAMVGDDYTAAPGPLTFGVGEMVKTIDVMIIDDGMTENEESIEISLTGSTGAVIGADNHRITIAATPLPRVFLGTNTSMADEGATVTIVLMLDRVAPGPLTVDYTVGGGTAQTSGTFADVMLGGGQVMFAQGDMMKTLDLGVINDSRNELAEDVDITLTTSTGVVIGATPVQQHTIQDNDPVPTVQFSAPTSTATEGDAGTTQAMIEVTLSAASGRTVVVPFAVNSTLTTANDPGDYSLSSSPLTFVEGASSQMITVTIVGDTVNEIDEELHLVLAAPADGSALATGQVTRRLTINDNDPWCQGTGAYRVCYGTAPAVAVALPAMLDTTNATTSNGLCEGSQPMQWTGAQGQPTVCVVRGTMITGNTTRVVGSRPLVLAATGAISIGTLDVSSQRLGNLGPASPSNAPQCTAFAQVPDPSGGGAGGSFLSIGGDGGTGSGGALQGRAANQLPAPPPVLRAGCHGQQGGGGDETGKAGGVVYIVAGGVLTITGGINASGSSATGGNAGSGGSGGGSGGMIVLHAAAMSVSGAAVIANGGGAAGGGGPAFGGDSGNDPTLLLPMTPALGGPVFSAGGNGFAGGVPATSGSGAVAQNSGGGGGGGGGGYVKANLALTGAMVSAARFDVP